MSRFHRFARLSALAMLVAALAGCCVLPFGARGPRGHHGYDQGSAPILAQAPAGDSSRSGWVPRGR